MSIGNELTEAGQCREVIAGALSLEALPGIYQGLRRGLPTRESEGAGYIELLNAVVGLGHWRVSAREVFCQEAELPGGGRGHEAGFDASVQIGNWGPQGFVVLAETPCTPGGHSAGSRWEARSGALSCAIVKALSFFGLGSTNASLQRGPVIETAPAPGDIPGGGILSNMAGQPANYLDKMGFPGPMAGSGAGLAGPQAAGGRSRATGGQRNFTMNQRGYAQAGEQRRRFF